jgi:hypothetical protein
MADNRESLYLPQSSEELFHMFPKRYDPDSFVMFTGRGNVPLAKKVASKIGRAHV